MGEENPLLQVVCWATQGAVVADAVLPQAHTKFKKKSF